MAIIPTTANARKFSQFVLKYWNSDYKYRSPMNDTTRNKEFLKRPIKKEFKNYIRCLEKAGETRGVLFYETEQKMSLIQDFAVLDEIDENFYTKKTLNVRLFLKNESVVENTQTVESKKLLEEDLDYLMEDKFHLYYPLNNLQKDLCLSQLNDCPGKMNKNYKPNILSLLF